VSKKVLNRLTLKKVEFTTKGPQITLWSETFNKESTVTTELVLRLDDGVEIYVP
jgi:hypothetical protein